MSEQTENENSIDTHSEVENTIDYKSEFEQMKKDFEAVLAKNQELLGETKKAKEEESRQHQAKKERNRVGRYCIKCGRKIPSISTVKLSKFVIFLTP